MEEVDEKIFVHVKHASREHAHIMIKPGDSNTKSSLSGKGKKSFFLTRSQ